MSYTYLNTYSYGNFTNPNILSVEGHSTSGQRYNITFDQAERHVLAVGNTTLGEPRIYNVISDSEAKTTTLGVFDSDFTRLGEFTLTDTTTDDKFEVYTGLFDGDNVLDPILIRNNLTHIQIWAFNGDTHTSWRNTSYAMYHSIQEHGMVIIDDDSDNVDELSFIGGNATVLFLVRVDDSFSTWTDVSLQGMSPTSPPVVDYVPINMFGSDPQLAILLENNEVSF